MAVRTKFRCHFIQKAITNSHRTINMSPVTAETAENKAWSKYTQGGMLQMHISNLAVLDSLSKEKSTSSIFSLHSSHYRNSSLGGFNNDLEISNAIPI